MLKGKALQLRVDLACAVMFFLCKPYPQPQRR